MQSNILIKYINVQQYRNEYRCLKEFPMTYYLITFVEGCKNMEVSKISRRERKKIESKEIILKVARKYFQEKGFDNTSIEDISEGADISKSTFFNYFVSKESLLYEIAEGEIEKIEIFITERLDNNLSAKEKIYGVMELMVEDTAPFLRLTKRVLQAIALISAEKTSPIIKIENILTALVKEGQKNGEFKTDYSSADIAAVIAGSYFMAFFRWVFNDGKFSTNDKAEFASLLDITLIGISTDAK